ncbi:LytR/AlgR family response regulator transcription factor [Sediminibacterium ginsengisoli]|uniref:DNA-binding response regulator, LytR/AlgR family n=1 Tax=Sediminibacterium ginsengisoli TaxID=413434 RepID=A0A1T4MD12_9BACT|nr:LytTR family DNA-binding domain-containing protein [Sediminibacterium ginsengisoli]SJZ64812.1 DNA-binding response regulator, LytR/AlgR family [Sediminibacterium ginsengisoli]
MIHCLVVDDEQHAIDVLTHYISKVPFLELTASSTNPLEALQLLNKHKIDLVFLDIQMPELSGLDFIKAINHQCKVIFTTAYSEFAAEGFELEAVDYLLKPVSMPRFLKAVQRAANLIQPSTETAAAEDLDDDYIFIKTESKGKVLKINFRDIDYVEGMKNYVAIHHNNQKTMALLNMKDLEDRLPKKHFARVHRSFIVCLNKISAVEGNRILLRGTDAEILLGDTYKAAFFELIGPKLLK